MSEIPDAQLLSLYQKRLNGSVEVNRRLRESSSAASNRILELESLIRDADAELRKYLSMNEGETIIGGIRNLAQAYYSHRDNAGTLESLVRDLAQHFQKIGNGAFSHDYIWITEQANSALSRIPKEMLPE